jgi:hypothetical protein
MENGTHGLCMANIRSREAPNLRPVLRKPFKYVALAATLTRLKLAPIE